jgi:hypothetical protein
VAERQVAAMPSLATFWQFYQSRLLCPENYSLRDRLEALLRQLFGDETCHLDHRPALINRAFDPVTKMYYPPANAPAYLEYITTEEHLRRTIGRMAGARSTVTTKGSDIWLKSKFKRLEGKPKPKRKWPSRPFQNRSKSNVNR